MALPVPSDYGAAKDHHLKDGLSYAADVESGSESKSPAKGNALGLDSTEDHTGDMVTSIENRRLKRGLDQRHLSMLGIAGAIGTGLFLGLGGAIQTAGPLGSLLGYITVGLVVCAVQFAMGEVTAFLPITGSFVRHAEFLVDPSLGFAVGWILVYGNILSIPSEITAICVLFQFWTDISPAVFIVVFIVLTVVVGISFIRIFGEIEFGFALLKIVLVIFLIILGLIIDLGGVPGTSRIGFRYWKDPGPFVEYLASGSWGNFLGYWSVMTGAVFSFAGVESLAVAAAETNNPRRAIPRACKNVFIRIVLFYVLAVVVVGMLVASNDDRLNNESGTAAQSPFVIAASAAGLPAIPSIVNAVVITSAFSASNQALLTGTRILFSLALKGQAPKVFLHTNRWGVPWVCVLVYAAFMSLSFMSLSNSAMTVFWWFVNLTAAGVLVSWSTILLNHIRLRQALKVQNICLSRLPWYNRWSYATSIVGLIMCQVILWTSGFAVFTKGNWNTSNFVSSYLVIPILFVLYFGWKFWNKTSLVDLKTVPLQRILEHIAETPEEPDIPKSGPIRLISWLWD